MGIDNYLELDLSIVRGLEYYTGLVFEIKAGGKWSCGGGGRYDNMIELYGGRKTPATGISYGVERVIQLMEEQGLFPELKKTEVYVAPVNKDVRVEALKIATQLRSSGFCVETDVMERNLRKQFEYVNAKGIRYCVIVGPKELKDGEVTVRDMVSGKERKVKIEELANSIKIGSE